MLLDFLHQRSLLCEFLDCLLLFLFAPSEEIWRVKKKVKCQGFSKVLLQICQRKKVCSGMKRIFELLSLWNKWGLFWSRDLQKGGGKKLFLTFGNKIFKGWFFCLNPETDINPWNTKKFVCHPVFRNGKAPPKASLHCLLYISSFYADWGHLERRSRVEGDESEG